jgi:hypothetical protein
METKIKIMEWSINKLVNPFTKRKIKENKGKYNDLEKIYNEHFINGYSPIDAINNCDPVSLSPIWIQNGNKKEFKYDNIDNLIYYKDKDMNIYCFEKETIEYFKFYNIRINPINFSILPESIFNNIKKIKKEYTVEDKTIDFFQKLTSISVFIDYNLFYSLNEDFLIKLYYELKDLIFKNITKKEIKNIFKNFKFIDNIIFLKKNIDMKKLYLIELMNIMIDYSDKYIYKYIIIVALGQTIPKVKENYPDFILN